MASNFKRSLLDRKSRPSVFRRGWMARVQRFFTEDVWRFDIERRTVLRRLVRRASRLVFLTLNGFVGDRCLVRASALTYVTLLSIVPLLASCFAVVKKLGYYEDFKAKVLDPTKEALLPVAGAETPPLRATVDRLLGLVDSTDLTGLALTGALIVLWAIVWMLGTVESALNEIWGVRRARSLLRKLTDYVAIAAIAPVGAVLMILLTSVLQSKSLRGTLQETLGVTEIPTGLVRLGAILAGWVVLTFVYLALPNTKTRPASAVLGGLVGAVLWWLALWAHLRFQIGMARINLVYSSFVAIPVFLVWVQLSWVIVLFGAELAFSHQHERDYRREVGWRDAPPAATSAVGLRVMVRVVAAFLAGERAPTADEMARALAVPGRPVDDALAALQARGLVAAVQGEEEQRWLAARDPDGVRVVEVLEALEGSGERNVPTPAGVDRAVERALDKLARERRESIHNLSLRELVERGELLERDGGEADLGATSLQPS